MLNRFLIISWWMFVLAGSARSQGLPVLLEDNLKFMGVTYTPRESYNVTTWKTRHPEYACEEDGCPLKRLQLISAEFIHHDERCRVYIYVFGIDGARYGKLFQDPGLLDEPTRPANLSYNRIKSNFMYGRPLSSATRQDIEDLEMMLSYYPRDSAKMWFNADYMVTYPFNMGGKKCRDTFTRTRAFVIGKAGVDIFLYFVMTDESIQEIDRYLAEMKAMFWFNDPQDKE